MKLLIITQKVDLNDPILGFFHRWLEEFAKHCESLIVICLEKGEYQLPPQVRVLSLGKEKKISCLNYLGNFYKYLWQERNNYDQVFVHMNQEYVLLGGLIWRFLGKKILFWRNHAKGNFLTRLAVYLSNRVFCTSPQSFTAKFKKTKLMPVGIDTDFFCPDFSVSKKSRSILFLGRISPVKKVDVFIEALSGLKKRGINFSATIAGSVPIADQAYSKMIQERISGYDLKDEISFIGSINQSGARQLYREHELYVNLTPTGSMDKTIFEAMACGTLVVVSNQSLSPFMKKEFIFFEKGGIDLAYKLSVILSWTKEKKFEEGTLIRKKVEDSHKLSLLVNEIKTEIVSNR